MLTKVDTACCFLVRCPATVSFPEPRWHIYNVILTGTNKIIPWDMSIEGQQDPPSSLPRKRTVSDPGPNGEKVRTWVGVRPGSRITDTDRPVPPPPPSTNPSRRNFGILSREEIPKSNPLMAALLRAQNTDPPPPPSRKIHQNPLILTEHPSAPPTANPPHIHCQVRINAPPPPLPRPDRTGPDRTGPDRS